MNGKRVRNKMIRIRGDRLPPASKDELDNLERLMDAPVDTSDIPPGRFVSRPISPIRRAIIGEMRRQGVTGHRLWKLAQSFCPRLSESAVYEFLANKRSVRVDYADAMLRALGLQVTAPRRKRAG